MVKRDTRATIHFAIGWGVGYLVCEHFGVAAGLSVAIIWLGFNYWRSGRARDEG